MRKKISAISLCGILIMSALFGSMAVINRVEGNPNPAPIDGGTVYFDGDWFVLERCSPS